MAEIPHTGFGGCGCKDCWPDDPIGSSDATRSRSGNSNPVMSGIEDQPEADPDVCHNPAVVQIRHYETLEALSNENVRLREELIRCGLLAVSERQDGCISRTTAARIREIAHRACWPDEADRG
jgi:hypothetical protein